MTITALPTPPSRQDPDNFAERADLLLAALPVFVTETNDIAWWVNAKHGEAVSAASAATTKAGEASGARDIALAAANYKGLWSALSGALNIPATVYHSSSIWMLTQNIASVGAEVPGVSTKWINVTPASGLGTAAYQPAAAFQPAIGALTGLLKSAGSGSIAAASAADIVAAIGASAVQNATAAASATTADTATNVADGAVSSAAKIANGIITWGKMVAISSARLLGRQTAGTGQAEEISIGAGLAMAGNVLSCTVAPPVTSVAGKTGAVTLVPADVGAAAASHAHSYAPMTAVVAISGTNYAPSTPGFVATRADGSFFYFALPV